MFRGLMVAAGLAWALGPRLLCAQGDPRGPFNWRQSIEGGLESGALYRLRLPPEVFDGCKMFPADLRLLDQAGAEWPFYLWTPSEEGGEIPRQATLLGQTVITSGPHRVELDLRVEPRGREATPRHDRVIVQTSGRDFLRRVEVLGSADGTDWQPMGAGFLVDQSAPQQIVNRVVTYPPTDLPFLRLRIHPDAKGGAETLDVPHVAVALLETAAVELDEVPIELLSVPAEEQKAGVQVLIGDAGVRNRPLRHLRVEAEGGHFALPVKVYGRNAETNRWRWIADGGVQRWGAQVRDEIQVKGTTYRFFKVELYHYENPPVDVRRVTGAAVPHTLVFRAGGGAAPFLYYGGVGLSLPRYDLQRETPPRRAAEAVEVRLGQQQINPQRLARGLQSYGHWLTMMAAGVVALLGVVVIVHFVRRRLGG